MTLEDQILNIAEAPNWYDSRELRAIALEVRKREDRIKQLEEMYEGVIGEKPELLGSNVMGLLKRELNTAQNRIKRLEEALEGTVKWIVHLADSGDAGFWDVEKQSEIIAARAALKKESKP